MYPYVFKNRNPKRIKRCHNFIETLFKLSKMPGASLHPWSWPSKTDMRFIPINKKIRLEGDMPMPITLLDRLIEAASHRMIYEYCCCRTAEGCKDYPVDIGCLMMGDAAFGANPDFCREVGVDEAKAHVRKAVDAGLVPQVGKARIDNSIFGIKDNRRLLTVCLCCECCCITRYTRHLPLKTLEKLVRPMDGVKISVSEKCTGCGTCAEKCYIKSIEIIDGRAVIGPYCRACGRCASVCPNNAIEISLEDPTYIERQIERIRSYVTYE
jgi:UDP-glucose 4-epimerase